MGKELDSKSEIVTIEIHRDEVELAGKKIVRANILPKIKIITGDALIVNPTLRGQFDFVFIDAEKGEYFKYLMLAEGKLGRGAIVESSLTKWATIWIMFGTQASTKAATFR